MCDRCEPFLKRMSENSAIFRRIAELEAEIKQRCAAFIDHLHGAERIFVSVQFIGELSNMAREQHSLFEKIVPDLARLPDDMPKIAMLCGVRVDVDPMLTGSDFRCIPADPTA